MPNKQTRNAWPSSLLRSVHRDESGQGMIEFALILPVFLLILVGVIEFGAAYSKVISLRQGVREAGRQASVANFGPNPPSCTGVYILSPVPSNEIQRLVCQTKDQSGVPDTVRVFVRFKDENLAATGPYIVGNSIVVCAIEPLDSFTGLMQPFLSGHYIRTKAAFRIEQVKHPPAADDVDSGEDPPSGQNWNWCT
jgi:hypothetical protein